MHASIGVHHAAFYTTEMLKSTLAEAIDSARLQSSPTRLTVGAVNVRTGGCIILTVANSP
jgi:NTE family protein